MLSRRPLITLALLLCAVAAWAPAAAGQSAVADERREVARLEAQLARLDARVGALAAEHNLAIDRLEAVSGRLVRARTDLRRARLRAREADRLLAARLRAVYAQRDPTDAELLFASGSISELEAVRDLLDRVAEQDARVVTTIRRERDRIAALRRQLVVERRQAESRTTELASRRDELDEAVAARERLLASARADLRRAIARERERRQRLAALRAAQRAQATSGLPYAPSASEMAVLPGGGGHVFPVKGGARYSDDWLAPRAGGRVHQGIDLFAPTGTPLVAVADGTVFRVGWNGLGGWRLWLRDGAGTEFYYAHLSAFSTAAREGATVARGTVLGFVGTTGDAQGTPPHVHFEIHPGGSGPVRPFPIVGAWPVVP